MVIYAIDEIGVVLFSSLFFRSLGSSIQVEIRKLDSFRLCNLFLKMTFAETINHWLEGLLMLTYKNLYSYFKITRKIKKNRS